MIVRYLDIVCISFKPAEADTPLVVDADAMLTSAIANEAFQPICRRDAQIVQAFRDIELNQLTPSQAMQFRRETTYELALKDPLSVLVTEGSDHERIITQDVMVDKLQRRAIGVRLNSGAISIQLIWVGRP